MTFSLRDFCEPGDTYTDLTTGERTVIGTDFDQIAEAQGWDEDSIITILRAYIDNQDDPDALNDFAREWADRENGL